MSSSVNKSRTLSTPLGYEQIDVAADAVVGLNPPKKATICLLIVEGGSVRWRDDGIDPTADVGMFLREGLTVSGGGEGGIGYTGDLTKLRFIQADESGPLSAETTPRGAGGAKLNVSYYRR